MNLGLVTDAKLKEILIKTGYINQVDMVDVEKYVAERSISLSSALLEKKYITKILIGEAIADFYKYPYANLDSNPVKKEFVELIPEEIAKKYRILISDIDGDKVTVATDNIELNNFYGELENVFFDLSLRHEQMEGVKKEKSAISLSQNPAITITYALPDNIDEAFIFYKKGLKSSFDEIIRFNEGVALGVIDEIIKNALARRASDVHIEPRAEDIRLRFRIDGVLVETGDVPVKYYEELINGIKLAANLRIDEHSAIQDGAIRWVDKADVKQFVDLRVSIAPTIYGESVSIRLLSQYLSAFSLDKIGLSGADQLTINMEIQKPFGMIMVVGPTGGGKTTTLYTFVQILNRPDRKIVTIEDPVEYRVPDIHQIQVNPLAGITFAKALKSIVRQDPDIVLVGEIRDEETASLATNIALTGHLLLSTFHANDAASGITRLMQMGVEPFLISSTLELVVSQRLARKICPSCKYSKVLQIKDILGKNPEIKRFLPEGKDTITLYEGRGCNVCNQTGYLGRTAIFEIIKASPEVKHLILKQPSTSEVWNLARRQGAVSLFEDGMSKVKLGITSLDELLRVAKPPEEQAE